VPQSVPATAPSSRRLSSDATATLSVAVQPVFRVVPISYVQKGMDFRQQEW
jgi:hypothetical protein